MSGHATKIRELLGRHIVGIAWTDAPRSESDKVNPKSVRHFVASGFVVTVDDHWVLVTAGHILRDINSMLKAGRMITAAWLADGWQAAGVLPAWHPFPLEEAIRTGGAAGLLNESEGWDYGIIPLSPLYAANLSNGGVVPINEAAWENPPDVLDGHLVLGFANEDKHFERRATHAESIFACQASLTILSVKPTQEPPECLRANSDRFYAQVFLDTSLDGELASPLKSIEGLSGGPVFGFKRDTDGRYRYWAIAVQSAWAAESRVLVACPLKPILFEIARQLKAATVPNSEAVKRLECPAPRFGS